MNSLIKAIESNTIKRKKIKKRIDEELNLSVTDDAPRLMLSASGSSVNRLIDEGAIIEGDGSVWAYIKKGTLRKFMNGENVYLGNLPDDYVGNIDIGHLDYATFPFPVGTWRKEDMSLVDIGDGRQGIDIRTATIDEESIFIKELKRLGYEVSMSIEAYFHVDEEASVDLGFTVIDEILIYAYAVCGDGKNVNSNGLQLKGEIEMPNPNVTTKDMAEVLGVEEIDITANLEGVEETEEAIEEIEEAVEEAVEETVEESTEEEEAEQLSVDTAEEPSEEALEASEEESDEAEIEETDADDADSDEDDGEEADTYEAVVASFREQMENLTNRVAQLEEANEALKKTNRKLSSRLANEREKKEQFLAQAKELTVELLPNEGEAEKEKVEEEAMLKANTEYIRNGGVADI